MAGPRVSVRMYRKILGDSFLITIGDPSAPREERSHVLIDCGVLQNVPGEAKLMRDIAADIRSTVGDYIELVVVTHEHWDHISGFSHASDLLVDGLDIQNLWLAWTERHGDPQADVYRAKSRIAKEVVARIAATPGGRAITAGVEDFDGAKNGKLRSDTVIPALIARTAKTGTTSYLEPGQVLNTPGRHPLRASVLGPPRNAARLMKDTPSSGDAKETYVADGFPVALARRYAIADSLSDALDVRGHGPFEADFRITPMQVARRDDPDETFLRERYLDNAHAWRRIDEDWLAAGSTLALKVDSDTNNTSLALALEIEPGGDILLFAADAQVGNWLSWHDQSYPSPTPPEAKTATAKELLGRTILYKVGHHASHNATLEGLGLELMTHPALCAMIPVVEAEARREKDGKAVHRGWNMPFPDLYARLLTLTHGRVLRGDADAGLQPDGARICDEDAFLDRVRSTDLYHELRIR